MQMKSTIHSISSFEWLGIQIYAFYIPPYHFGHECLFTQHNGDSSRLLLLVLVFTAYGPSKSGVFILLNGA